MHRCNVLLAAIAVTTLVASGNLASADGLRIGGSGGAIGALKHIAPAFTAASRINVEVIPSLGSAGGIRAAKDGVLDIGVSARGLTPEEVATGVKLVVVARSPFGLATSHRNPNGLKSAEIADIYKSVKPSWADGTPMRFILRPKSDSDTLLLGAIFPGASAAIEQARRRPDVPVAGNDQDNADMAEQLRGSLTGLARTQAMTEKRDLRFVTIDGVAPSLENLEKGTYPYAWTMRFVFPATMSPSAASFMAFLQSPRGQALLRETGNLPAE